MLPIYKKKKKTKNTWTKGPKVQRKKMRDQSDFKLLGHQVCLRTMQLEGKRQNYFAYK
jgi:hypothetical protein